MNTYEEVPVLPSKMGQRLAELCALRDQVNALNAPIEVQLNQVNAQIEALRLQAMALAEQVDANRGGGERWFALKREIGMLAQVMSGRRPQAAQPQQGEAA